MKKFNMREQKIGVKLGVAFFVVVILSVVGIIQSFMRLNQVGGFTEELYEGPYKISNLCMEIRRDINYIDQNAAYALLEESDENYTDDLIAKFEEIKSNISYIKKDPRIDQNLINSLENEIDILKSGYLDVANFIKSKKFDKAFEIMMGDVGSYYAAYGNASDYAEQIYEQSEKLALDFKDNANREVKRVLVISSIIGILIIMASIISCIAITKKLVTPIVELEDVANKMADGNFDIEIDYNSNDELGSLANSMRDMSNEVKNITNDVVEVLEQVSQGNFDISPSIEYKGVFNNIENSLIKITDGLSETISQIDMATEEVQTASNQVASGAQMLSQGTTEQAGAIEELSATILEISEKIKVTAQNASQANELSSSAGSEVKDGNHQMKQMVNAMEEISFTSNEIGRIIKTIDDIAFQTNILALNAAVEAARAGEAGKGFAVVADEVRNLAAKSAEAAKNTATLIESSINAVDNGTKIVDNTAKSLQKIVETTNNTIILVDEIAKASEEQANAISQVSQGIEQISDVVQTNSATSEESAAASEELSGQAQMLKSLIENFNLKNKKDDYKEISF